MKLDTFTRAFFETALWASNDYSREDGGDPLDENHSIADIAPETLEGLAEECARFQSQNAETLEACYGTVVHHGKAPDVCCSILCDEAQAGRDFWLTRCGHGCGFWDGGWPVGADDTLTKASEAFGNVDLYIGDDWQIWASDYETRSCRVHSDCRKTRSLGEACLATNAK